MFLYSSKYRNLIENQYEIKEEAHHAALLTTGNGYFGVRGSFEEFGSMNVQGAFIRGLIDEIIEIPNLYVDNIYMRKYYFNELEAKKFEYQDSGINFTDFLLVRFMVGNKTFFPWEGKIIEWTRYIDTKDGSLLRSVIWDDGKGNLTQFKYKRLASFDDNHKYIMKCSLKRLNHKLPCRILSGIDTYVKTNGQKSSKLKEIQLEKSYHQYLFNVGSKYGFEVLVSIFNHFIGCNEVTRKTVERDGMYYEEIEGNQDFLSVEKMIYVKATMDEKETSDLFLSSDHEVNQMIDHGFDKLYLDHLIAYQEAFNLLDIDIEGNEEDDGYLKYANYQTLISIDRYDQVHSLSAKNLTGQKYNQFVWWDAEIFQFPIYLLTQPKAALNTLMYRYHRLEESKNNAKLDGFKGAKFAFCSSVKGDEKVWAYARHPFLQIHINSDIAYAIINYHKTTNDLEFMRLYGLEMLVEISRFWISRVNYDVQSKTYEILNVTGTDEHHPYVDNNAYTNYLTSYILNMTYKYLLENEDLQYKYGVDDAELNIIETISKQLKLPLREDGLIPQFDGYFNLTKSLEVDGNGIAKGFQMKESGLYHQSQVIKQPDVIMLYTYLNLPNVKGAYDKNWKYYESMCEASSSLTYPVHAIAAIDHDDEPKFFDYWDKSIKIDIIDLHHEGHLGLHAACMAGGWYSIYRGLFGFEAEMDYLKVNPKFINRWKQVSIKFMYQNQEIRAILNRGQLTIHSENKLKLMVNQKIIDHDKISIITHEDITKG